MPLTKQSRLTKQKKFVLMTKKIVNFIVATEPLFSFYNIRRNNSNETTATATTEAAAVTARYDGEDITTTIIIIIIIIIYKSNYQCVFYG